MIPKPRLTGSLFLVVGLGAVLVAQAPAIDIKLGLWEIASTTSMDGEIPGMDTSKMTPAQQAQMKEAMKTMMANHTDTTKSCMTKEKFDQGELMMKDEPGMKCKNTIKTNTKSVYDASVSCTGDHAMSGDIHVEAISSTAFKGTMKMKTSEGGKTMTVDMAMTGKWLAAECGTVK